MTCHALVHPDGSYWGHLCTGPKTRQKRTGEIERKWCFSCRKHLDHEVCGDTPIEISYYGTSWYWECPQCKGSHTQFPGCEFYEWDDG